MDGGERFGAPGEAGGARFGTGRDGAPPARGAGRFGAPPGDLAGGARRGGGFFGAARGGGRFGAPLLGGFLPGVEGGFRPGTDGEGLLGGRLDGVEGFPPGEPPPGTRGGGTAGFARPPDIIGGGTPSVDSRNIALRRHATAEQRALSQPVALAYTHWARVCRVVSCYAHAWRVCGPRGFQ